MKKNITIIILAIAVAILLYWLLSGGKDHDTHASDHAQVIATYDTVKAHDAISARIIDSLSKNKDQQDIIIKDLMSGQEQYKGKLNKKAAEVSTLVAQIREINQDTGYFGHLLDSLERQVESLTFLLIHYEQNADSLNNANAAQKDNYEAIIKEKDKAKAELQAAYDQLYRLYDKLFKDYTGARKDNKRERLKTKIAALLALVVGGAAVLK
jgi:hypothetical protein